MSSKRDPVIAALIGKLPASGASWPRIDRVAWLRQMAMAFDSAYGAQETIAIDAAPTADAIPVDWRKWAAAAAPPYSEEFSLGELAPILSAGAITARPRVEPRPVRFFIDAEGFARRDPGGVEIDPKEVPVGAVLYDKRSPADGLGGVDTIIWKTGTMPARLLAEAGVDIKLGVFVSDGDEASA